MKRPLQEQMWYTWKSSLNPLTDEHHKMIIKDNSLPPDVLEIIRHQVTERPYTGTYNDTFQPGTYLCRGCGAALFRSQSKFAASCGWPNFDETLINAVSEKMDTDGLRTEIICARCLAHLGHVFDGEGLTPKNRRYCVNSKSLDFVESTDILDTEEAIVAGGCFWGVEYYLKKLPGVLGTEVGYTGGKISSSYHEVCAGNTGHFEAVRVLYSPLKLTYETLLKCFFEIHDPTQIDGQGPDLGPQYQSAVFYYDKVQKHIATQLIQRLQQQGLRISTKLLTVQPFWPAEDYHQRYYEKNQQQPYCHTYTKRFMD